MGFAGWGEAEGDGHYFCFAEEESVCWGGGLVCGFFLIGGKWIGKGRGEGSQGGEVGGAVPAIG